MIKVDFVTKSNLIHYNKYGYDKVPDSFKAKDKVTITCTIHGDFEQTPDSHKRGSGCPYCANKNGVDVEKNYQIRVDKINKIIDNHYNGNKIKLISLPNKDNKKFKFRCEIHGDIVKSNSQLHKGQICGKCLNINNKINSTQKEIEKMTNKHNGRFEYLNLPEFFNLGTELTIRCKEHNHIFTTKKSYHTSNTYGGCSHCIKQHKQTTNKEEELVIEEFKMVHGDRYNYDKVVYVNSNNKVIITCEKHGDFKQIPSSHLRGSGCPSCKHSTGEKMIQNFLKKMNIKYTTQKNFYGCMNEDTNRLLPFDLYVPEFHTCIEFDGYQHFIPVERWGGEDNLKEIQRRDNIKNQYCKDNDINLIRIPYTMSKLDIVELLNKSFDKNLVIEVNKRFKWVDVNIIERIKDYKTREEFRLKENTLWQYCYRHKLLDEVCGHMESKRNVYSYETAKEICQQYINYTLLEKELPGLIAYIRKHKYFELVEHMDKRRVIWTDEEIMEEIKKYRYKQDVRKLNLGLYKVLLKRDMVDLLEDKTIHWTEQMVRDVFIKCDNRTELNKNYRGAENYAVKNGLYGELSSHFIRKNQKKK